MPKDYQSIQGAVLEDSIVPARGSWSRRLDRGQMLRIVDLEGRQAVDFLCYNAHDHADRYAAADTCDKHDTIGGCCSAALNTFRYGVGYQPNCRDNFLRELAKAGDYVDLRAESDVLAVISNCPQINNPVNDFNPTPIRVVVWNHPKAP